MVRWSNDEIYKLGIIENRLNGIDNSREVKIKR